MTSRQIFESLLIELSKVNAPSLLLSEYNYYINKAINNYCNKKYNLYDINQQSCDDLRVLKSEALLQPRLAYQNMQSHVATKKYAATYEVDLPSDYFHILNCICFYRVNKDFKCWNASNIVDFPAKRLTADSWSIISQDYYNRPSPERPYYYIHNVNPNNLVPTNPVELNANNDYVSGTDMTNIYSVKSNGNGQHEMDYTSESNVGSNLPRVLRVDGGHVSTVEKATAYRYGNPSSIRMEIRYGLDNSIFELQEVQIDYLKTPQYIRLTQDQMDLSEDTSQILEWPDYVCQEIINELTLLVMARVGDPLLPTFAQVNQTIANPAQAQSQPPRPAPQQQGE